MRLVHPDKTQSLGFDTLLWLWSLTALCAAASHIIMPLWTAAGTNWAPSVHWQREIAFFDIILAMIFIWAARQSDVKLKRNCTLLICLLSLALGENHAEGWLEGSKVFHIVFAAGNSLAFLWGAFACWHYRHR